MYLKFLIFVTLFFFASSKAFALDGEEAAAFASFIQGLVETTQTVKHGATCAIGKDEISKILIQNKSVTDLDLDSSKFGSCRVIYVAMNKQKGFGSDLLKFSRAKIFTIAIFDGFTESGGMVQVEMGRRNFELTLNSMAVKEASVRLNALAMSLVIN